MIERYLEELRRHLGWWPQPRLLAEVEDHLRTAAEAVGEEEAVRRFGAPAEIARAYAPAAAVRGAALVVLAALAFPILSYPVFENSLPPAPWPTPQPPGYLQWKQEAVMDLFLLALAASVVGAAAWRRGGRIRLVPLAVAASALVAMSAIAVALNFQWVDAVPGAPGWLPYVSVLQAALAIAAASLVVRAALLSRG